MTPGTPIRVAAALLALSAAPAAIACGHCIEDRVAAVYDYQLELLAGQEHLRIAYLGVRGARAETQAASDRVAAVLRENAVAMPGTIRTSVEPAAAAFAWHGDDQALRAALRDTNSRLAPAGLSVELLRTWDARRGLR